MMKYVDWEVLFDYDEFETLNYFDDFVRICSWLW
jgi:hypothetical protein